MRYQDRIVRDAQLAGGQPVLKGTGNADLADDADFGRSENPFGARGAPRLRHGGAHSMSAIRAIRAIRDS
jgi:hypothetical protein